MRRVVVPVRDTEVAPRFDLAAEVWIGLQGPKGAFVEERTVLLPQASADSLCHLILSEGAQVLVCGGIEQKYYDYLIWKKVLVYDGVIATLASVKRALEEGTLTSGAILMARHLEG